MNPTGPDTRPKGTLDTACDYCDSVSLDLKRLSLSHETYLILCPSCFDRFHAIINELLNNPSPPDA